MSLHIFAPFFSRSNPSIVGITANSGAANRNRFDTRPKTPLHSLSKYSWIDHISLSRKKISAKYNLPSNRAKLEPPVFERSERSRMIFDDRDQTQRTATGKESKNRRERPRDLTIVSTTTRGDERRRRERERGLHVRHTHHCHHCHRCHRCHCVSCLLGERAVLERRVRWNNDRPFSERVLRSSDFSPSLPFPPSVYHTHSHVGASHTRVPTCMCACTYNISIEKRAFFQFCKFCNVYGESREEGGDNGAAVEQFLHCGQDERGNELVVVEERVER